MSPFCMRGCQWCHFSNSFLWRVTATFWHHLSSSSITPCCQYIAPTSLISLFLLNALLSNITALFILAWGKDGGYSSWYHTHTLLPSRWYDRNYCVREISVCSNSSNSGPLRLQPSAGDSRGGFVLSVSGFCCIDSWKKRRILWITRSISSSHLPPPPPQKD